MNYLDRRPEETTAEYHKRLVYSKFIDKTLPYATSSEVAKIVYGQDFSEDVARRMLYGSCRTYRELDCEMDAVGAADRILILSDFHVPFNLPISIFEDYVGRVDTLVLNGDIEDCQQLSKFTKMYRVDMIEEMVDTRQLILDLVRMLSPKRLYITVGNHEKRLGRVLANAVGPEIMGFMPDSPLDLIVRDGFRQRDRRAGTDIWYDPIEKVLDAEGVEVHFDGEWYCKVGRTIIAHPLAYSSGMLKTTEKAVNYFLRVDKDFNALVLGHTHKLGSYIQGDIYMYEQGCCCDLSKLDYGDAKLMIPNQAGFLYMCHDRNGDVIQEKTRLVKL